MYSIDTAYSDTKSTLAKDGIVKIVYLVHLISTSVGNVEGSIRQRLERFVNRFPEVEAEQGLKADLIGEGINISITTNASPMTILCASKRNLNICRIID